MRPGRYTIDRTGQVFGRLTVVARDGSDRHWLAMWRCLCSCGASCRVRGNDMVQGKTRSCGCLRADVATSFMHDILGRRRGAMHGPAGYAPSAAGWVAR